MIEAERRKSAQAAETVLATLSHGSGGSRGVPAEAMSRRCLTGDAPRLLTAEAKLHDLTIVPVTAVDGVEQWYAESIIFGSGRPILILPEAAPAPRWPRWPSPGIPAGPPPVPLPTRCRCSPSQGRWTSSPS